ncbi:MAG: GNAT family N-acetyltransferase [bacterium]
MNDVIIVRPATHADLEAIGDLWVELISFHAAVDERFAIPPNGRKHYMRYTLDAIRDPSFHVLVAVVDDMVVGYVLGYVANNLPFFPSLRYAFLSDISVSATNRRRGVGQKLVAAIKEWFAQRGLRTIQLNAAYHNPVSQAFWSKQGCTDYISMLWLEL